MKIFNKQFYLILASLVFFEELSMLAYFIPDWRVFIFFGVLLVYAILTFKNLKYGVYISLVELVIGSKGYLFYFDYNGTIVSIRIAFWLILMSVWFLFLFRDLLKMREEKIVLEDESDVYKDLIFKNSLSFVKSKYFSYFSTLFIFVVWGLVNAYLNKNEFSNIFFDFNGWLFFLLIFPVFSVVRKNKLHELARVITVSISWLVLKTLIVLFLFSHFTGEALYPFYRWIRTTGVGEITKMDSGFYRIFFQSHIFALIAIFFVLAILFKYFKENNKKNIIFSLVGLTFLSSIALLNFSRSNWVGLVVGIIFFEILILKKINIKKWLTLNGAIVLVVFLSIGLIAGITKFPYPKPKTEFSADLITARAKTVNNEAGASSRWALLDVLKRDMKENIILGKGFGATVTYKSSDPRVLEKSVTGEYTTYAFEWGWLDIWFKLGFFGFLVYLILTIKLFFSAILLKNDRYLGMAIGLGIVVLASVSFFSPYMNHPLGIGYLIVSSVILDRVREV